MNPTKPSLPEITEADRTPLVDALLEIIQWQSDRLEQLEDEIQALKKQTRKPKFKSSERDKHRKTAQAEEKRKVPSAVKPST